MAKLVCALHCAMDVAARFVVAKLFDRWASVALWQVPHHASTKNDVLVGVPPTELHRGPHPYEQTAPGCLLH